MSWDNLSMSERADYIRLGVMNGITSLDNIRNIYNEYKNGGPKPKAYARAVSELPKYSGMYTDSNGNKSTKANFVYVDEGGKPIPTKALNSYELTRTKWKSSLKSTGQTMLEDADTEMTRKAKAESHVKDTSLSALDLIVPGITPKDAIGVIPIVGDAIDIYDIGESIHNKDYMQASIGIGTLLLPNIIEKPAKMIIKGGKSLLRQAGYYLDDILNYKDTARAISERRYAPLMSKKRKDEYKSEILNRMNNEILPHTEKIAEYNRNTREFNKLSSPFSMIPSPSTREVLSVNGYPSVKLKKHLSNNDLGQYSKRDNNIFLATREGKIGGHRFRTIENILDTGAHEGGHFWSNMYPSEVGALTVRAGTYYGPNLYHRDIGIFEPIYSKFNIGEHNYSPDEFIADNFRLKTKYGVDYTTDALLPTFSEYLAPKYRATTEEVTKVLKDMRYLGYNYGGFLK